MKLKYTKLQLALEIIGLLLLVGMVTFIYIQWDQIPQQVPMHYNALGEIDSWGSKYQTLILPAISILLYSFMTVVSFFPQIWNVPVQITDKNKEAVYLSTKNLIIFLKVEMLTIFFYLNYHTVTAQPLSITFLPILMIIIFGTLVFFIVRIIRLGNEKKYNREF
ncbi:hypothetical protein MSBR3_1268 [Methanosarcina barkeri 3]|uniref:DUF1648 domain-containing protein n=2 Tax=Methanosarcina barkeri TaxID=2208 RepID=A0A0E3SJK2_METBA|nr:hypothetical protein MSBR3_1268 [Methanosarcina barkeri 3]